MGIVAWIYQPYPEPKPPPPREAPNAAGTLGASLTHVFQVMKVQPASTA